PDEPPTTDCPTHIEVDLMAGLGTIVSQSGHTSTRSRASSLRTLWSATRIGGAQFIRQGACSRHAELDVSANRSGSIEATETNSALKTHTAALKRLLSPHTRLLLTQLLFSATRPGVASVTDVTQN